MNRTLIAQNYHLSVSEEQTGQVSQNKPKEIYVFKSLRAEKDPDCTFFLMRSTNQQKETK